MLQIVRNKLFVMVVLGWMGFLGTAFAGDSKPDKLLHVFASFPSSGLQQTPCFPTDNDLLVSDSTLGFAARIRTNDKYGMPGWTRDMGDRFHKGVDIIPIRFEKTKKTVRIDYYDPKTRKSYAKNEPVLIPKDRVYSVLDGVVLVANKDQMRSGYGRYAMIQHRFANGVPFVTMYAHLNQVDVKEGDKIKRGEPIGWMGSSSSSSGGRSYLSFVPHCHFEVGRIIDNKFSMTLYARQLFPKMLGGNADPRNIQPYNPIDFLRSFKAEPRAELLVSQNESPSSERGNKPAGSQNRN